MIFVISCIIIIRLLSHPSFLLLFPFSWIMIKILTLHVNHRNLVVIFKLQALKLHSFSSDPLGSLTSANFLSLFLHFFPNLSFLPLFGRMSRYKNFLYNENYNKMKGTTSAAEFLLPSLFGAIQSWLLFTVPSSHFYTNIRHKFLTFFESDKGHNEKGGGKVTLYCNWNSWSI